MRNLPIALRKQCALEDLALCYLLKLTLTSGVSFYYTDASQSIVYNGKVWRADPGISVSAIRDTTDSLSQTGTIDVGYSSDQLTESMVRKGLLDGCTHQVLLLDYRHPEMGAFEIFSGAFDRVTASNKYTCTIDLTGWQGKNYQLNGVYSLKCRNVFCDKGCKLNIEDYSYPFELGASSVDGVTLLVITPFPAGAGYFGSVLWTKGRNAGNVVPVSSVDGVSISLLNSPGFNPLNGDEGILRSGCDYYKATCKGKYNNLTNFQAEPSTPQGDTTSADKSTSSVVTDPLKPANTGTAVYGSSVGGPKYIG